MPLSRDHCYEIAHVIHNNGNIGALTAYLKLHYGKNLPDNIADAILLRHPIRDYVSQIIEDIPRVLEQLSPCECGGYFLKNSGWELWDEEQRIGYMCHYCATKCVVWSDGYLRKTAEPRRPCLAGYHGSDRGELYRKVNFNDPTILGLEFEVYIKGDASKIENLASEAMKFGCQAEQDSSLNKYHGVEFIFAPVPLNRIVLGGVIHSATDYLRNNGVLGWDAGNKYGMHVTCNARHMSRLHVGKFCSFINGSKELCQLIAGRPENRFGAYTTNSLPLVGRSNKYQAASLRSSDRLEVRIFRSTLFFPRIRRNCEFVDSVREFTKVASTRELTVSNYLAFLAKPEVCKQVDAICTDRKIKETKVMDRYGFIRDFLRVSTRTLSDKVLTQEVAFREEACLV